MALPRHGNFLSGVLVALLLSLGAGATESQPQPPKPPTPAAPAAAAPSTARQDLFQAVLSFMNRDGWKPAQIPGKTVLRAYFKGTSEFWMVIVNVREQARQVVAYSIPQLKVPEPLRPAVAEFITRANYGLYMGNFEMDFADGEVRFKTSIDTEGGILTDKMIDNLLSSNCVVLNKYLPGLRQVLDGKSPADAIQIVESKN